MISSFIFESFSIFAENNSIVFLPQVVNRPRDAMNPNQEPAVKRAKEVDMQQQHLLEHSQKVIRKAGTCSIMPEEAATALEAAPYQQHKTFSKATQDSSKLPLLRQP